MSIMKTIPTVAFSAEIGTVSGYNADNSAAASREAFVTAVQAVAKEVQEMTDVYISGCVAPAYAVYDPTWGCPAGGEAVYRFWGTANPRFVKDLAAYENAVIAVCEKLRVFYKQSTVTVTIFDSNGTRMVYLTNES